MLSNRISELANFSPTAAERDAFFTLRVERKSVSRRRHFRPPGRAPPEMSETAEERRKRLRALREEADVARKPETQKECVRFASPTPPSPFFSRKAHSILSTSQCLSPTLGRHFAFLLRRPAPGCSPHSSCRSVIRPDLKFRNYLPRDEELLEGQVRARCNASPAPLFDPSSTTAALCHVVPSKNTMLPRPPPSSTLFPPRVPLSHPLAAPPPRSIRSKRCRLPRWRFRRPSRSITTTMTRYVPPACARAVSPDDRTETKTGHLTHRAVRFLPGWVFPQNVVAGVMPKKANWDLRRDVEKKMERLEKRTQRAMIELMREEEERRMNEAEEAAQAQ